MPHVLLHLSPKLSHENWTPFFKEAHQFLSQFADINNCKSRILEATHVHIGNHIGNEAFIYLDIGLRPRPPEVVKTIGDHMFELLKKHADPLTAKHKLVGSPTMNIHLLERYWS